MKKIISIMMVLALLLMPVLSLAEAAEELAAYESYTHTNDQFTILYPNNWFLLNAENIATVLESVDDTQDEQLSQLIATYSPQIQQLDMVMFLSETGLTNINIVCQEVGVALTGDMLMTMAPTLVAQLSSTMEGIEFTDEGSLLEINGVESLIVEYTNELAGEQMQGAQVYVPGSSSLCIFTLTCLNADEFAATSEAFGIMLNTLEVK